MPKRTDLKKILLIGSGPIIIGQACEFDYSGTQACKALREEGYIVILVNSNPATIMTDPEIADSRNLSKRIGFPGDTSIALLTSEMEIRWSRKALGVLPVFKRVDTCAAEFEAYTPYYYSTYEFPFRL